jgi:DNA-binding CsgD family transcriptional regulator
MTMEKETAALDSRALRATLDRFNVGVAIVGDGGCILHVNDAARGMLEHGANIRARNGRLCGASRAATDELLHAIRVARSSVTAVGAGGIGVPLPGSDGQVATARVMPLAHGDAREPRGAGATAAVFITRASGQARPDLAVIAQSYHLTRAELRLLNRLLLGENLVGAAASLGVTVSTARSHLKHLFAKTGTFRQTHLIALVHRLVPPVGCCTPCGGGAS